MASSSAGVVVSRGVDTSAQLEAASAGLRAASGAGTHSDSAVSSASTPSRSCSRRLLATLCPPRRRGPEQQELATLMGSHAHSSTARETDDEENRLVTLYNFAKRLYWLLWYQYPKLLIMVGMTSVGWCVGMGFLARSRTDAFFDESFRNTCIGLVGDRYASNGGSCVVGSTSLEERESKLNTAAGIGASVTVIDSLFTILGFLSMWEGKQIHRQKILDCVDAMWLLACLGILGIVWGTSGVYAMVGGNDAAAYQVCSANPSLFDGHLTPSQIQEIVGCDLLGSQFSSRGTIWAELLVGGVVMIGMMLCVITALFAWSARRLQEAEGRAAAEERESGYGATTVDASKAAASGSGDGGGAAAGGSRRAWAEALPGYSAMMGAVDVGGIVAAATSARP